MEPIKETDNLYTYIENYFNNNYEYHLRPNHRAPIDQNLNSRMKQTFLDQRLNWVKRSMHKRAYSDPFQTSLFATFDTKELGEFLKRDREDKLEYINSGLFVKMPRKTMQDLFLNSEIMSETNYEDIEMLAKGYAVMNSNSIYDFITKNKEAIPDSLFYALYSNISDPELVSRLEHEYGKPVSLGDWFRYGSDPNEKSSRKR